MNEPEEESKQESQPNISGGREKHLRMEISNECPLNQYDTFNLVFPDIDEFLELMFTVDTNYYLECIILLLKAAKSVEERLGMIWKLAPSLAKIIYSIQQFVKN